MNTDPFSLLVSIAPEPRDLYWLNLSAPSAKTYRKLFRSVAAVAVLFLLITSSTFIVSSIAALLDLKQLGKVFPPLGKIFDQIPIAYINLIQGVIPTALLAIWNSCLPSILLFLCQFQGIEVESWMQLSLLSKYYFYLIWNIIFVIPFARSVVTIIASPKEIIERLGQMLPKAAVTMINYIIIQGFVLFPAQILLIVPITFTLIVRLWSKGTPRRHSYAYYPSILTIVNYGIVYPMPILVFVIGFMYSSICPLILPFCSLYFGIGFFIYKYILLYVHIPPYESRGSATPYIVNRCLFGLILMQLTMMGVLALKSSTIEKDNSTLGQEWSEYAKIVLSILPLIPITMVVYNLLGQVYQQQIKGIPMELFGKLAKEKSQEIEHLQTELTELTPLISPSPQTRRIMLDDSNGFGEYIAEPDYLAPTSHGEFVENPGSLVVETPMIRVPGVLDQSIFPDELEHHGELESYLHPCLIGKLPVFWIDNVDFKQLRIQQFEQQSILFERFSFRQRAGREDSEIVPVNNMRSFFDGLTSWIHLAIS